MDLDDLRIKANRYGYVYLTTFTRPTDGNEFHYVGQHSTGTLDRSYYGSGTILKSYVKKYGESQTLHVRVLAWAYSQAELDFVETLLIAFAKDFFGCSCLNLKDGGSFGKHTESSKQKIASKNLGKVRNAATVEALRRASTGKTHTKETKARISAAKKGVPLWSVADRVLMSLSRTGRKLGPKSEAVKEKLRQANLGKTMPESTRSKISAANMGKIRSQETRERMSEAQRRRGPRSAETKAKIAASLRARSLKIKSL